MARSCVFCGSLGVTAEHVWPRWVADVLPGNGPLAFSRKSLLEPDPKRWKAPSLNVTIKQVCASCNNGWMSTLETEAKPLLSPMIEGKPMGLSAREQKLAATWAAKTAAMLGLTHSKRPVVPAADVAALFATREPPRNTYVWIGAYEGEWSGWYSGDVIGLGPRGNPHGFASCTTLVLGRLVFQLLGHDLPEPMTPVSAPEADRLSIQIWPDPRPLVSWPPDFAILDGGLEMFAGQFASRAA
jgi:hypothetical protein